MKIRIAKAGEIPDDVVEEAELASDMGLIPEASQEQMAEAMDSVQEIVISEQVMEFLMENNISVDEFMGMFAKKAGRQN